jgi:predicted  nucleic acid-binding Zn-ribbon protein
MQGIDRLLELQQIDSAIDRLSARRRVLESGEGSRTARKQADDAEAALGELRLAVDALARNQQRLEHEIDSLSKKASAEEKRLYDGSIANAKELGSLQHEIENLKRRRSDREDELLGLMEEREGLDGLVSEAERVASGEREAVDRVAAEASDELGRIGAELMAKGTEREGTTLGIDPELLELYEDLRPQKKGVAVAALVDGVCQGCHEKLSAVELDRLKRVDGVKRCEHCRRILIT